jgi:hypothetical protein
LAFPGILALHSISMGFVAGASAAVDLRIFGFAPRIPLTEMRRFIPLIWFSFWVSAVSGTLLLISYPTKALTNPIFYVKLSFIGLALVVLGYLRRYVLRDPQLDYKPVPRKLRVLAAVSLAAWIGVLVAGRALPYTYTYLLAN